MKIQLNGEPHTLENPLNISALLESIGLSEKPVVVELNLEPVLPKNYSETNLADADRVEIVALAAGG